MKKIIKINIFVVLFFLSFLNVISNADQVYFIDVSKVLNQSIAGKEAQDILKKKINSQIKNFNKKEKDLKKEETDLISKKKLITSDEYQKKVVELRSKVASYQKNKQENLSALSKLRTKARTDLIQKLNPILENYMKSKSIKIIVDKKSVLLGDTTLDITSDIITILNKELKSLNLK